MRALCFAVLAFFFLFIYQANASVQCDSYEKVEKVLIERYGEAVTAIATTGAGQGLVRLWENPTAETWTITASDIQGLTCIVMEGRSWEGLELKIEEGEGA